MSLNRFKIQGVIGRLNQKISDCRKCEGLNMPKETMSAPGWGSPGAFYFAVGQSLHSYVKDTDPQIPFVGTRDSKDSGLLLYEAFRQAEIDTPNLNNPGAVGNLFITNVVHCHPPGNRPSESNEKKNCAHFLTAELAIVEPEVIITLGANARDWFKLPRVLSTHVSAWHDEKFMGGMPFVVAHHPSFINRYGAEKTKQKYMDHMKAAIKTATEWALERRE